jgi:hypothetical protein
MTTIDFVVELPAAWRRAMIEGAWEGMSDAESDACLDAICRMAEQGLRVVAAETAPRLGEYRGGAVPLLAYTVRSAPLS